MLEKALRFLETGEKFPRPGHCVVQEKIGFGTKPLHKRKSRRKTVEKRKVSLEELPEILMRKSTSSLSLIHVEQRKENRPKISERIWEFQKCPPTPGPGSYNVETERSRFTAEELLLKSIDRRLQKQNCRRSRNEQGLLSRTEKLLFNQESRPSTQSRLARRRDMLERIIEKKTQNRCISRGSMVSLFPSRSSVNTPFKIAGTLDQI